MRDVCDAHTPQPKDWPWRCNHLIIFRPIVLVRKHGASFEDDSL